jgi:hypothetical protein
MEKSMTLVKSEPKAKPTIRAWRELPITRDTVFRGKDECGRTGWFLRITVSGLYPRRVGPYLTKRTAIDKLEEILAAIIQEPLLEMEADITDAQAYVIEGIPTLNGRCAQKGR